MCKVGFDLVSDLKILIWGNVFQQEGFEILCKFIKGNLLRRGEIGNFGMEALEMEPHALNFVVDRAIHVLISGEELCSLLLIRGGCFISKAFISI